MSDDGQSYYPRTPQDTPRTPQDALLYLNDTMCDSLLACFHTYIGHFRQLYKYLSLSGQIMHAGHNTQWKAVF